MRRPLATSQPSSRARLKFILLLTTLRQDQRADRNATGPHLRDSLPDDTANMHRPAQVHAARAHLAAEHGVLGHGHFLLSHDLTFAVRHVLDHRFSFSEIWTATTST